MGYKPKPEKVFRNLLLDIDDTWFLQIGDEDKLLLYLSNAICGESGEIANVIKKYVRAKTVGDRASLKLSNEIVDVLYYLLKLADLLKIDISEAWRKRITINRRRWSRMLKGGE